MPYSITREEAALDLQALRSILAKTDKDKVNYPAWYRLAELADSIEEPTEFGSMVRAPWNGKNLLWIKAADNSWWPESGIATAWSELRSPEVLRVGIGETVPTDADEFMVSAGFSPRPDVAPESTEEYRDGFSEAKLAMRQQLRNLRSGAITAERQNAYDKAIAVVKEIQP